MRPATPIERSVAPARKIGGCGACSAWGNNSYGPSTLKLEILAVMIGALVVEQFHQQRQRLLLDVAPRIEVDAEAVEFVLAIARAEAERETAIAQNIDEGGVLGDPQRIGERQRDHRGADLDAFGQRREIGGIDEHVGHDAVFVAEVMLGDPGIVEAELVGAQDLLGDPRVHVAVRIGLGIGVGMRGEKNAEFHASSRTGPRFAAGRANHSNAAASLRGAKDT